MTSAPTTISAVRWNTYVYISEDWLFQNFTYKEINPLNAELNPICHLLALLGDHHILHVSRITVNNQAYILVSIPLTFHFVTAVKVDVMSPTDFVHALDMSSDAGQHKFCFEWATHYTFFATQTETDKVMLDYRSFHTFHLWNTVFQRNMGGISIRDIV